MNILNLIETLDPGGAEMLIENNLGWLKNHTDWKLDVAALFGEGRIAQRLRRKGISVYLLNLTHRFNFIEAVLKIRKLLKENKYDILHTHLFHANIYGRMSAGVSLKNRPVVITSFHNPDYSFEDNKRFSFKIKKSIDYLTYKCVNSTAVAVSKAVREDYKLHFGLKDIRVIYNSYLPFWEEKPTEQERDTTRKQLGIAQDMNICVTVARFSYQKGYDIYIKSIKKIVMAVPNTKFIFIGEGKENNALKILADKNNVLERILFLKRMEPERLKDYVAAADLFVLPSRFEAFGIAVLEAMIAKVPVVATDTGGLKELIADGKTGILVKPEDCNVLAEKIIWALDNKAAIRKMAEEGYLYARRQFNIENIGCQWRRLYNDYAK